MSVSSEQRVKQLFPQAKIEQKGKYPNRKFNVIIDGNIMGTGGNNTVAWWDALRKINSTLK